MKKYIDFPDKNRKVVCMYHIPHTISKTCNYLKIQNGRFGYFVKFQKMAEYSAKFE